MPLFKFIPQTMIAAILIVSAIKMVPVKDMALLWSEDKIDFVLLFFVTFICLMTNGA